ncbi:hypothetical protein A7A09_014060 [Paracoccus methylarcula]|uniref:Sulfotransferase domain-containing protein n=1 Tax=Paracoccus methylarcula TaxID=72022 RepID=A0A3R7P3X0_9RHOB|nr:hypothetical protein A7A09_014060 [Paracoccus methylarcula]
MKSIVHIGHPKTGTTSIQKFLWTNRASLRQQGILYRRYSRLIEQPELAVTVHHRLGAIVSNPLLCSSLGIRDISSQAKVVKRFEAAVAADLSSTGAHTMVFSCEYLGIPSRGHPGISALRDWLAERFKETRIILYIRRQDQFLESDYSQYLRNGGHLSFETWLTTAKPPNLNQMVLRWERVFGPDALEVRVFDRRCLAKGNLVDDFCTVAGLPLDGMSRQPLVRNKQYSMRQAELVRRCNSFVPEGLRSKTSGRIARKLCRVLIESLVPAGIGRIHLPAQARQMILEDVRRSNEALRQRRFPDSKELLPGTSCGS